MVRLVEFVQEELPFDVVQDMKIFMNNDKLFYRKSYYPCMVSLQRKVSSGKEYDVNEMLKPTIEAACNEYSKKFDIPREQLLKDNQVDELVSEIMKDELPRLRRGEY
jgi:superfamily I DNA and RNA helicase